MQDVSQISSIDDFRAALDACGFTDWHGVAKALVAPAIQAMPIGIVIGTNPRYTKKGNDGMGWELVVERYRINRNKRRVNEGMISREADWNLVSMTTFPGSRAEEMRPQIIEAVWRQIEAGREAAPTEEIEDDQPMSLRFKPYSHGPAFAAALKNGPDITLDPDLFERLKTVLAGSPVDVSPRLGFMLRLVVDDNAVELEKVGREAWIRAFVEGDVIRSGAVQLAQDHDRVVALVAAWLDRQQRQAVEVAARYADKLSNGPWLALSAPLFGQIRAALASGPASVRLDAQDGLVLAIAGKSSLRVAMIGDTAGITSETCHKGVVWSGSTMSHGRAIKTARAWLALQSASAEAPVAVAPVSPRWPAHTGYQMDVLKMSAPAEGYRRTPEGEPEAGDLLPPGSIVRTSYGTGPYRVKTATRHLWTAPDGTTWPSWSLVCADAEPRKGRGQSDSYLNELVAVGGRILHLFANNADEVMIEQSAAQAGDIAAVAVAAEEITVEPVAKPCRKGKAARPKTPAELSLEWRFSTNPPPADVDTLDDGRTIWACTVLDQAFEREVKAQAPAYQLGTGWAMCWTPILPDPKRWAPERKAEQRRKNLRQRLDKKVPLFAALFEAEEVARRPAYFDPEAIEAGRDMPPVAAAAVVPPRRVGRWQRPECRFEQLSFADQLDHTAKLRADDQARHIAGLTVAAVCRQLTRKRGKLVTAEDLGQAPFDIIDMRRVPRHLIGRAKPHRLAGAGHLQ